MKPRLSNSIISLVLLCCMSCAVHDNVDLTVQSKEELEQKLRAEAEKEDLISVAYAVVKNDEILHSGAFGYADTANEVLAREKTRYLVASISKTITAVALMQLVDHTI